jgi:hypothetical protein
MNDPYFTPQLLIWTVDFEPPGIGAPLASLETISKFGRTRTVSLSFGLNTRQLVERDQDDSFGLTGQPKGGSRPVLSPDARRLVTLLFNLS